MAAKPRKQPHRLAVVGIGNTLAGDDGAGIVAVRRLRERFGLPGGIDLLELPGDLLAVADWLDRADRFIFVDAAVGIPPGEWRRFSGTATAKAPPAGPEASSRDRATGACPDQSSPSPVPPVAEVPGFAPSLHQLEIGAVMVRLEALHMIDPFPAWEVWGIGIELPDTLGEGLSPLVDRAVDDLVRHLALLCRQNDGQGRNP